MISGIVQTIQAEATKIEKKKKSYLVPIRRMGPILTEVERKSRQENFEERLERALIRTRRRRPELERHTPKSIKCIKFKERNGYKFIGICLREPSNERRRRNIPHWLLVTHCECIALRDGLIFHSNRTAPCWMVEWATENQDLIMRNKLGVSNQVGRK